MPFIAFDRTVPLSVLQDKYGLQASGLAPTPTPSPSSPTSKDLKGSKSGRFSLSRVLSRKSSSSSSSSSTKSTSQPATSAPASERTATASPTPTPRLSSSSESTLVPAYSPPPPSPSQAAPFSKTKSFHPESAFALLSEEYGFGGGVVAVPVLPKTKTSPTAAPASAETGTRKEKRSWKKDEGTLEARYAWAAHRS